VRLNASSTKIATLVVVVLSIAALKPLAASPRRASPEQSPAVQTPAVSGGAISANAANTQAGLATYANLPLRFEANVGQTDAQVQFISRGSGYTLFLTSGEAVFELSGQNAALRSRRSVLAFSQNPAQASAHASSVLRMKIVGGIGTPTIAGLDQLPGVTNYLIGKDPTKWHTGITSYSRVQYSDVYSGVDLIYYGNQHQLEYDLVVKPGSDPNQLSLAFDGMDAMSVGASGDISIVTKVGNLTFRKPMIYQMQNGKHVSIDGNFKMNGTDHIGFQVAPYDRTKPLVIDPVLAYSTYLGGSVSDVATDVAVDSAGNAYLSGETWSTDFPIVGTSISGPPQGSNQVAFVSKLNSTGTALIYSTYLGGSAGWNDGWRVAVDSNAQAYVAGETSANNFPVTSNAFQTSLVSGAAYNAFLTKLSANGQSLLYSTYLGGNGWDYGNALAVDSNQNAYVGGLTGSTSFPTTTSAFQRSDPNNYGSAFLSRINTTLSGASSLVYSTYLGGSTSASGYTDGAFSVAVAANHNAYVVGYACSQNFPTTSSAYQTTGSPTYCSAFLSQVDTAQSGNSSLVYSTYLGGRSSRDWDVGWSVALDATSKVYVSGWTGSPDFPTTTGAPASLYGEAFVAKFDLSQSGSSSLVLSTRIGGSDGEIFNPALGSGLETAASVQVDPNGNIYLAGWTWSYDFPVTSNAIQTSATLSNYGTISFLTVFSPNMSNLIFSTYLGGTPSTGYADGTDGMVLDQSNNVYLAGVTSASNFETTSGVLQTTLKGYSTGYVTKIANILASVAPTIIGSNTGTFAVGSSGIFTVTTTGFPTPTVSESGTLPSGVTFNASTSALKGTPAAGTGGRYAITFTASNGVGSNATQNFTLTVDQAPAFTSVSTKTFTVGTTGSFTVTTTGYPISTLSATGTLPPGVSFNTGTGVLSGTPTAGTGGAYAVTFTASNGFGSNASQNFTLTVNQAPVFTSGAGATFAIGSPDYFTVTATGTPAPSTSESGVLPSGVTFNTSSGALSGTPGVGTGGSYPITFVASNGIGTNASQNFTLTVNAAGGNVFYYFGDALGSARVITTSTGTVCYDADFYSFGGERSYTTNCTQNYKFTGKERDSESGLDNFGARYNSSQYGRFMTPDPLTPSQSHQLVLDQFVADPQNWNKYAYSLNNPVSYRDVGGHFTGDDHERIQKAAMLAHGYSAAAAQTAATANRAMDHGTWMPGVPGFNHLTSYETQNKVNPEHGERGEHQTRQQAQAVAKEFMSTTIAGAAEKALQGDVRGALADLGSASHTAQDIVRHNFESGSQHAIYEAPATETEKRAATQATNDVLDQFVTDMYDLGMSDGLSFGEIKQDVANVEQGPGMQPTSGPSGRQCLTGIRCNQ
jgi:RHS repeat-associated protein